MDLTLLVSSLAAATAVCGYLLIAVRGAVAPARWWLPAALSAAFAAWSVYAVLDGGPLGFWAEHHGNPWRTHIWMDLLLAVGVAWYLLQPRLRAVGVAPLPWLALVVTTGSIGLLAVLARVLHGESTSSASADDGRRLTATGHGV
ncbi:hypothetical protein [Nocardioides nanhaiensis]|uniref:Uncharacterized protein n=1 Tax=Nocardioides nanhaiensis TaxID=1476871 RepID=A0ABP8X317_9ACTN